MSDYGLQQRQAQVQAQVMSQKQIQSLTFLSMGADALREAIYKEVDANPALVIKEDKAANGVELRVKTSSFLNAPGGTRLSKERGNTEASDSFQKTLEAKEDTRCSLQDHLLSQLHMMKLSDGETALCEKLIGNLDSRGFHILAPVSLADKNNPFETEETVQRCMEIIQQLDPIGTCTTNTEESLKVQALQKDNAPLMALFILDGHFDFLDPPVPSRIARKVEGFFEARKKLFGVKEDNRYDDMEVSEAAAQEALDFIRTLDPYPARDYSTTETHYVSPDVRVRLLSPESGEEKEENFSEGIVKAGNSTWKVTSERGAVPELGLSKSFTAFKGEDKEIAKSLKTAQEFIEMLESRKSTVLRAACVIVKRQHEFFEQGPGHLIPLKQKDIADILGVHETTISRMASSKYIQCKWGLFQINYFFTAAVGKEGSETSRDKILLEIQKIQKENAGSPKKLSAQKISDILAERGIKVARRTVAKYLSLAETSAT